ncbi:OmpA family protein [Chitinophaga horti]|uniref:OmpA family protein n=1 Tax=Chitinophaga horti TaxID=2920382 RepID=A0ABY6J7U6_9BACT|nr:OmpA family protein [Chitinophaga horti]UYQ95760.1 OmpA family protein [Chitinophaga horti]
MKRVLYTGFFLVAFCSGLKAQYILREADEAFGQFKYVKAAQLYERAYSKKKTLYAAGRAADCHRLTNNYREAQAWYAIASGRGATPIHILQHAQSLQQNARYPEAQLEYQRYAAADNGVTEKQLKRWTLSCDSAMLWMQSPANIRVTNLASLNSPQSDWAPVPFAGGIAFASDRSGETRINENGNALLRFDRGQSPDTRRYAWTGNEYLNLLFKSSTDSSIRVFPLQADTRYHVGPASFTADGKEIFFARTKVQGNGSGAMNTVHVAIFSSKKDDAGNWSSPVAFFFNKADAYSVGDPFISADGQQLYFSSNMPGGKGGADIYTCRRQADGSWSAPENLAHVNTDGDERTPAVVNGWLYFASNGHIGMGGLDIFYVSANGGTPVNMRYPVNSPQDDFAFSLDASGQLAYLSSNREGGIGSDDVYRVAYITPPTYTLQGIASGTGKAPLPDANISLLQSGTIIARTRTDATGKFELKLNTGEPYQVAIQKDGFKSDTIDIAPKRDTTVAIIKNEFNIGELEVGKTIALTNIYFDYNKADIRADAKPELDKLVRLLKTHPAMSIELGTHTDSRGNDAYNEKLSQRRAESVVAYLVKSGIADERLKARGYGESQLLNSCANGVVCSEAEHQLNRRTEFKITGL